jgi:hypothetical protein
LLLPCFKQSEKGLAPVICSTGSAAADWTRLTPQEYLVYHRASNMTTKGDFGRSGNLLQKQNVVFIHPDLGIGGAERLIIDAAVGLQKLGHKVTIFISHCDPTHCFDEARDGI